MNMLFLVEEVNSSIFFFILFKDKQIRLLLRVSIEYMKRVIPPIRRDNDIVSPVKYIKNSDKICGLFVLN